MLTQTSDPRPLMTRSPLSLPAVSCETALPGMLLDLPPFLPPPIPSTDHAVWTEDLGEARCKETGADSVFGALVSL